MDEMFDLLYAEMHGDFCSKWRPKSECDMARVNYRQRLPNEVILETDFPEKGTNFEAMSRAAKILFEKNFSFRLWDSGGKGYHLHVYFDEKLSKRLIRAWVFTLFPKPLANSFDDANWGEKRLIGMEGRAHRKTGNIKTLVNENNSGILNHYPVELMHEVVAFESQKRPFEALEFLGKCLVCEYAVEHELPRGSGRNIHLVPNMVAALAPEKWALAAQAQGKSIAEFEGWAARKPQFNCVQLQRYAKKIGLHESMCLKCPYRVGVIGNGP